MAHIDPLPTQGDQHAGIPAELVAAGFEDPEEIGRAVDYRPVETDGTARAAALIAELL